MENEMLAQIDEETAKMFAEIEGISVEEAKEQFKLLDLSKPRRPKTHR